MIIKNTKKSQSGQMHPKSKASLALNQHQLIHTAEKVLPDLLFDHLRFCHLPTDSVQSTALI